MRAAALKRWWAERVPIPAETLRKPLKEALPIHLKTWLWCLGGTPALFLAIQVATGNKVE